MEPTVRFPLVLSPDKSPISSPRQSAPCTALACTVLALLPLLPSHPLINGLSCMLLDRDTHIANYTVNAVTAATTNKPKHDTVTTAGLWQKGTRPARDPPCSSLLPETLSSSLYTSAFPLYSKTEAHLEVNTPGGRWASKAEAVCVSALHTPARPAEHRLGAGIEAPLSTQFSQCVTITGAPVLNNFMVAHCENSGHNGPLLNLWHDDLPVWQLTKHHGNVVSKLFIAAFVCLRF